MAEGEVSFMTETSILESTKKAVEMVMEHTTKQMETSIFPSSQSSSCDLLLFLLISHTSGEAGLGSYHEYPYKISPKQCDDGNLISRDGCSSTWIAEPNFKWTGGTSSTKDTCAANWGDGN